MSSASVGPPVVDSNDPFWRGWRVVREVQADGSVVEREVALTEEDLLHPLEGDAILQNDPHHRDVVYLYYVLITATTPRPETLVLSHHRIDWGHPEIRPHCPDAVVFDPAPEWDRQQLQTFPAEAFEARPRLVVEVTSATTRGNDLDHKRQHYFDLVIPYYLIVDRLAGPMRNEVELIGLRRGPKGWRTARANDQGRLLLPHVNVWVGVEDGAVVCYDEDGEPFPVYSVAMQRIAEEVEARREAIAALEAAEERSRRDRQRVQRERRRRHRAETAAASATERAEQAEAEAAQMREELARMQAELQRLRQGQSGRP